MADAGDFRARPQRLMHDGAHEKQHRHTDKAADVRHVIEDSRQDSPQQRVRNAEQPQGGRRDNAEPRVDESNRRQIARDAAFNLVHQLHDVPLLGKRRPRFDRLLQQRVAEGQEEKSEHEDDHCRRQKMPAGADDGVGLIR
jgi:hypothetical protein